MRMLQYTGGGTDDQENAMAAHEIEAARERFKTYVRGTLERQYPDVRAEKTEETAEQIAALFAVAVEAEIAAAATPACEQRSAHNM